MEVTERSIVSPDNYAELVRMIKSNDEGSQNLALTIIEQSDFEKSVVYILCLLKEAGKEIFKGGNKRLEEVYPELHKNITDKLAAEATNIATLSFKRAYEIAVARNIKEELEFMLKLFTGELESFLQDFGFDFLEYFDVHVSPKKK